jgi:hypothetical protein
MTLIWVDMSTVIEDLPLQFEIPSCRDPHVLLCRLEADRSLFQQEQLEQRLTALDGLDAHYADCHAHTQIGHRVQALRGRLEVLNTELYESVRSDSRSGSPSQTLIRWIAGSASRSGSPDPLPGPRFDWRDEMVSGILQFREPGEPEVERSPEMVPYQPTPVRHILQLIAASAFSQDDVFVDLGSGLGHVPLLVSMLTGVRSLGIEVQPAYVLSAQQCAQSLRLGCVQFVPEDARVADLSRGNVFYLYSPFTGSILTSVLKRLRTESTRRTIKVCSLGPCTRTVAEQAWLRPRAVPDLGQVAVFESR